MLVLVDVGTWGNVTYITCFNHVGGVSMNICIYKIYIYIYKEPKWCPLFCLEFRPCVEGLTFKNRGHWGALGIDTTCEVTCILLYVIYLYAYTTCEVVQELHHLPFVGFLYNDLPNYDNLSIFWAASMRASQAKQTHLTWKFHGTCLFEKGPHTVPFTFSYIYMFFFYTYFQGDW